MTTSYREIIAHPSEYCSCRNCGTLYSSDFVHAPTFCHVCQTSKFRRIFKTTIKEILKNHSEELDMEFSV